MPAATTGKPTCVAWAEALPWIVDASDATFDNTFDNTLATPVPVLVDLWAPEPG